MQLVLDLLVPGIIAGVSCYGMAKRVDVYDALLQGAAKGLEILLRILPALVTLLTVVAMLRASGALELAAELLAPALEWLGIPPETVGLMLVRPISGSAALTAVMLALTAFAVSNLGFLPGSDINMSIFSIRTLVDFSGVLILTVQHEQLRENALHSELAAMDEVLHRQYEQYKRSKEGIKLINRRYHELKVQIADIRAERDRAKQDAALARMESGILQYEAENKTGNPVLDTLLTAKTMECQQENITITSVADGRMLGFLTIRELCTIVGVALDNAIAAVRAEPDPEKRLIKVAVYSQGGFAMLRFEHYTETVPALDADGLPQQGSDLKSVRTTVGQHGGSMTLHWENNWCTLRILFPLSKNK